MNLYDKKNSEIRWIPDGFHFYGPEEGMNRRKMINAVQEFFQSKSYKEVFLPSFDYTSTFTGHLSSGNTVLSLKESSGYDISPSNDLTIQVVKGMADSNNEGSVFYIGKIVRENTKHNGRRRELLQAGAEILGDSSIPTIRRMVSEIYQIVSSFGIEKKFELVIGNNAVINKIFFGLGLSNLERNYFQNLVETKDWTRINRFLNEKNAEPELKNRLRDMVFLKTDRLKEYPDIRDSLEEISEICSEHNEVNPDLSLTRNLDYYTGIILQGYIEGYSEPFLTGGVYNDLFEKFAGEKKNACGYALNLDLLEEVLDNQE